MIKIFLSNKELKEKEGQSGIGPNLFFNNLRSSFVHKEYLLQFQDEGL